MQYTDSLVGKHIGIVGFGKEGQAVAQFLLTAGLTAHIFDAKQATDFSAELVARYQAAGFTFVFGHDFADFGSLDCIQTHSKSQNQVTSPKLFSFDALSK